MPIYLLPSPSLFDKALSRRVLFQPVMAVLLLLFLSGQPFAQANARIEQKLLTRADAALREQHFFSPEHNNAYDLFHSVLLLNADNSQARSGLQNILLHHTQIIRKKLEVGHYTSAKRTLSKAEIYYPANPLLMDLKRQIAKAERDNARVEKEAIEQHIPEDQKRTEYPLPRSLLRKKSPVLSDYIARIAKRIRENDESVMIHAATDAQGRWIYKQMKAAVPGYRVRGDIKISRESKIVVLPPLY